MTPPDVLAPPAPGPLAPGPPPTFSVLMAAHDVAPYVGAALDAVLAQEYPAHEIIVVDDGSTDDLDGALAPYRDRITLIRQDNRGESAAKNAAARVATGDFVVIADADDVDRPGRLAMLRDLAVARPDLDILATDCEFTVDGIATRRYHEPYNPFHVTDQRRAILRQNWIASPAVRRTVWRDAGGYDESIRYGADWECWIRLLLAGSRAGLVDAIGFSYRQRSGQLTGDRTAILAGRVEVLTKTLRHPGLTADERDVARDALRTARHRWAREAVRTDDPTRAAATRSVLRDRDAPPRDRLWAAWATVLPGPAGRRARRSGSERPPFDPERGVVEPPLRERGEPADGEAAPPA